MSEAGEYENMKAMEQAVLKNVRTALEDGRRNREELEQLKARFITFHGNIGNLYREIRDIRNLLAALQQEIYAKGTTSYGDNGRLDDKGSEHTEE